MTNRQVIHAGCAVGTDGYEWPSVPKEDAGALSGTNNALAITANRFNFVFNMRGPSFFCDTACSSSLYGAHLGKFCVSERRWDPLEWFISFGTQLYLTPYSFSGSCQAHMLSAQGRCFTFNATADGYIKGDGTNGIVMKHGQFKEERWCIFRGSNANQDGRSASLTAPNGPAQEQCIWAAIREAGMVPSESTAWDCHGTGTSLGDPIEVGAVKKVQIKYQRKEPLLMSTIKTNIGHLEGGAAMSGVLKCILEVHLSRCLPTLHFRLLNPHLEHAAFDAIFETELGHFPHRQGHSQVSSFGFGGSNAHAIWWGENVREAQDSITMFLRKLREMPMPEVHVNGNNPDDWDSDWPDPASDKGARYQICFNEDDFECTPIRFERIDVPIEAGTSTEDEEHMDFYDISGNFNEWCGDRMLPGSVRGHFVTLVDIPESGELEFHFLKDGEADQIISPASHRCRRKSEKVLGPGAARNSWLVLGTPGAELQIELLLKGDIRTVVWIRK